MLSALISWAVLGLVAGAIGRLLVPGSQPIGCLMTILLGVAGSFAGGFLNYLIRGGDPLQPSGFLMSVIGATILLAIYVRQARKKL